MRNRGFEIISTYSGKNINLPVRKTKNSCGYDFESAEDIEIESIWKLAYNALKSNDKTLIKPTLVPTGIKSYFNEDEVLILANRSSGPIKKGLVLSNSIGIIESDYYNNPSNEGHLMFSFYNFFPFKIHIKKGEVIGQGMFQKFLKTDDDNTTTIRTGGFGSTDK